MIKGHFVFDVRKIIVNPEDLGEIEIKAWQVKDDLPRFAVQTENKCYSLLFDENGAVFLEVFSLGIDPVTKSKEISGVERRFFIGEDDV